MLELNQNNIVKLIRDGERVDDRDFDEYRDVEIIPNYVHETANGSAMVRIGDTKVLVGISIDTDEPYPDTPKQGALVTNVELTPMAAPRYETGPPGDEAIEIARVVDRGIRESGMIDLEDLIIEEGEKSWTVFIDIHVVDYDGSLIDAASIGAATSLLLADMPELNEDGTVNREETQGPLPTEGLPLTLTGSKVADEILFDTTAEEEEVRDARLTATFTEEGNVVNMQKGEPSPLTQDEIMDILHRTADKADMLREKVREAVEEAE
ncbi:MAG: exosome complex protein Rrp42 [Candidatus Nanohaloarchaea archaeon]|nr:exosome complex protein Rrp42 [Candidatus Nanohaloarchaea archaeon]